MDDIKTPADFKEPELDNPKTPEPEISEPTVKRGRGRPRKSATPPNAETLTPDEKPTRKPRTRKNDSAKLAQQLIGLHKMVAMLPGMEVFEIGAEEATILADGMQAVANEYDVVMSGKTGAALQLLAASAMVYGPRVVVLAKAKKAHRAQIHQKEMSAENGPVNSGETVN